MKEHFENMIGGLFVASLIFLAIYFAVMLPNMTRDEDIKRSRVIGIDNRTFQCIEVEVKTIIKEKK